MTYATLAELRAEGVTASAADDSRALLLLEEASAVIERLTGWFFEPRALTLRFDGRGVPTLGLPFPPIRIDELEVNGSTVTTNADALVVVGAPVLPGFDVPRLTRRHRMVFPRGAGNVVVTGLWGFTEADGTPFGRIPPSIRRACLLLALRGVSPLGAADSFEARSRWRIIEERTRDQSYRLDSTRLTNPALTGDPEIDQLLAPYLRPSSFGAA